MAVSTVNTMYAIRTIFGLTSRKSAIAPQTPAMLVLPAFLNTFFLRSISLFGIGHDQQQYEIHDNTGKCG